MMAEHVDSRRCLCAECQASRLKGVAELIQRGQSNMARDAISTIVTDLQLKVISDAFEKIRREADMQAEQDAQAQLWEEHVLPGHLQLWLPVIFSHGEEAAAEGCAWAWQMDLDHARLWMRALLQAASTEQAR